jgi:hypothetical protein
MRNLPDEGFLRLVQIIGQREVTPAEAAANRLAITAAMKAGSKAPRLPTRPRPAIEPIFPKRKSAWWAGIAAGRYPQPYYDGRTPLWKVSDIRALLESLETRSGTKQTPLKQRNDADVGGEIGVAA